MMIGQYIRRYLKKQGRTQRWLANELGIDEKTFSWKLTNNSITADDLLNISLLLDIDLNQLKENKKMSKYCDGIERDNIKWSVKYFLEQIDNKIIKLNKDLNGFVPIKSSLIYSILCKRDRIGLFVLTKYEKDGYKYNLLDGNTILNFIADYTNGVYELDDINDIEDDDGSEVNFSGFSYEELPSFAQKRIQEYIIQATYLPTDDSFELNEMLITLSRTTPIANLK